MAVRLFRFWLSGKRPPPGETAADEIIIEAATAEEACDLYWEIVNEARPTQAREAAE